jgi:hypothetical protein
MHFDWSWVYAAVAFASQATEVPVLHRQPPRL